MFEIKNLSKQFGGEYALRNVTMNINREMNFIIGSSGSGKTTLLKIISGMEQEFNGEVVYLGKDIQKLTEQNKSYFYNNVFGFVWQDFNLRDDLTVLENIMLPQYLKKEQDEKSVMKVLCELKISEFAKQKAGKLSGGQKQRVAIARELIKNPQVIIADEPTSALDEKSSKITMDILRSVSKIRTVIVVTHDTSLINPEDSIYELDKGELIVADDKTRTKQIKPIPQQAHKLSLANGYKVAGANIKSKWGRTVTTALSLLVAATLLLVTVSGTIMDSSKATFDELFETYGESILDISLVGSFMSASGTGGNEENEPNANVDQDIGGLYDKYKNDKRVSHIVSTQSFHDIKVDVDGKEYNVENSNTVPSVNKLTAGVMPMGDGNEVVVPNSFVKKLGLIDEEALGKTIDFKGALYNWTSGEPVVEKISTTAKIVGVVDTTVRYEYENEIQEYTVDDSFFFSKSALDDIYEQANMEQGKGSFTIRTKTPSDLIAIKDELGADGIVPLGQFELVEDMVRLSSQTKQQSGSAVIIISMLAVVVVIAVSMMTALTRKREYAIYKVSGYSRGHLTLMTATEFIMLSIVSSILFVCISPLTNMATTAFWGVNILNGKLLCVGMALILAMGVLSAIVTTIIGVAVKASNALKTGDR